jgi:hypothetical protein
MKKIIFFMVILVVSLLVVSCSGDVKAPTTPREAADLYVKMAQSGDVKAVENLSTERYKRRAESEVGRFQRYSKCTFTKVETEKESEGTWHAFHYKCEKTGGGTGEVIVAVLEKDGKYLVGDID